MTLIMLGPRVPEEVRRQLWHSECLAYIQYPIHILRTAISENRPVGLEAKKFMARYFLCRRNKYRLVKRLFCH